jgi:hypothetical protein
MKHRDRHDRHERTDGHTRPTEQRDTTPERPPNTGLAAKIDDAKRLAPDGASVADITAIADAAAHGEGEPRELWRERWDDEAEEVVS